MEARKFEFTRASVDRAACPAGKSQALFWDTRQPGLGLRVTALGAKSFVFESKLGRQTIRMTIGPASMPIRTPKDRAGNPTATGANTEAARLAALVAQGVDPRAVKAAKIEEQAAERAVAKVKRAKHEVLGLDAWAAYCEARDEKWGERNRAEHVRMVAPGGQPRRRSSKLTKPGPLRSLLNRPLASIDAEAVEQWVARETKTRAATAALGFRLLRAFINWCARHREYKEIVVADACASRETRETIGQPRTKSDSLQREQLAAWFAEVRKLPPVHAAYLQSLLLTGARRTEIMLLRWDDVDFQWKSMRIRDKVEGERTIPLTPWVAHLLSFLPRRNEWVFSSATSESGRLMEPRPGHNRAVAAAGLPPLTLHGLRRSFGVLAEWVECPAGIIAQIMGHKPSAIAEKTYRPRPLDLLRMWHERIESFILTEAGIEVPQPAVPTLRVVA
ncbi:MAG: integrase family protein [Gemmatimonadales bacterium]|nr:integrase family protein [Gemmatimonadales bacterium]